MKRKDTRTLKIEAQQELRNQIIRLSKKLVSNLEVAQMVKMSKESASKICQKFVASMQSNIKIKSHS